MYFIVYNNCRVIVLRSAYKRFGGRDMGTGKTGNRRALVQKSSTANEAAKKEPDKDLLKKRKENKQKLRFL